MVDTVLLRENYLGEKGQISSTDLIECVLVYTHHRLRKGPHKDE